VRRSGGDPLASAIAASPDRPSARSVSAMTERTILRLEATAVEVLEVLRPAPV
jgi:hypothetical protein